MTKCVHCGSAVEHAGVCPSIKAIEYYPDGGVRRVEYKVASDYLPTTFSAVPGLSVVTAAPFGAAAAGVDPNAMVSFMLGADGMTSRAPGRY